MMSSITPVGESSRKQRWSVTTTAHIVGATLGGLSLGTVAGALSVPLRNVITETTAILVIMTIGILGLALDLARRRPPGPHRQVDEAWLTMYRGWVYGGGFGLQLGTGVTTIIVSCATWVMIAAAVLSGSVTAGAAIGGVFGLVRGLPVLTTRRLRTTAALHERFRRLETLREPIARITMAGQAVALVGLGAMAVTS